jgi:hypothetical protein
MEVRPDPSVDDKLYVSLDAADAERYKRSVSFLFASFW